MRDLLSWPREVKIAFLAGDLDAMPDVYRRKLKAAHDAARGLLLRVEDPENRTGVSAAVEIADRTEGKVTDVKRLEGAGVVRIEYVNDWRSNADSETPDAASGAEEGLARAEAVQRSGGR